MTPELHLEIGRSIFREANDAFFVLRPEDLRILEVNPAAQRLIGMRRKELLSLRLHDLVESADAEEIKALISACQTTSYFVASDGYRLKSADGYRDVQVSASRIHTEPETLALLVVHDITQRRKLEEKLRHAQRMESIGRLAGGVAHEFNNLLTIINGYTLMLLDKTAPVADSSRLLNEILRAGDRAASFTQQLLAFGSKQKLSPRVLDLNELVADMGSMVTPMLKEDVRVVIELCPEPLPVEIDQSLIEQVFVNLAANARDAMPSGGTLRVATTRVELSPGEAAGFPGLATGPHAVLRFSDTGCGMDSATREKAFEPFFSTKKREEGSGLGLAMVYGAIKQSRGHVMVDSEPSLGTAVTIRFPTTDKPITSLESRDHELEPLSRGAEQVLLVEDDDSVRTLVQTVLQDAGYSVLAARNGAGALDASDRHSGPIDLLLTDFHMPGMQGDELVRRLRERRPESRVLFMSGCVNPVTDSEDPTEDGAFIAKPFAPSELASRVRMVLDACRPPAPTKP